MGMMHMKPNTKANIYVFTNMFVWILMSILAFFIIRRFIRIFFFRIVLSIAAVIGLAYFETWVLSRFVNRIAAFFLHDTTDRRK